MIKNLVPKLKRGTRRNQSFGFIHYQIGNDQKRQAALQNLFFLSFIYYYRFFFEKNFLSYFSFQKSCCIDNLFFIINQIVI
jgi:hypothetical protein